MGRVRNSLIQASDFAMDKIKKNDVSFDDAVNQAVERFDEDKDSIVERINKKMGITNTNNGNSNKTKKNKHNKMSSADTTNSNVWVGYVGPVHIGNVWHEFIKDILSIKANCNKKDGKDIIIRDLLNNKKVMAYISSDDWETYSKEFTDENECNNFITFASFNNSFKNYVCENIGLINTSIASDISVSQNSTEELEKLGEAPLGKSMFVKHMHSQKTKKNNNNNNNNNVNDADRQKFVKENYKLNEACKKSIEHFNKLKNKTDNDYKNLKTYGIDSFTPLRMHDMKSLIPEDTFMYANGELDGKELSQSLKWYLRGLDIDDAIKKVKIG